MIDMIYEGIFWSIWNYEYLNCYKSWVYRFSFEVEHFVLIKYFLITRKNWKILSPTCFVNIILRPSLAVMVSALPVHILKTFFLFYENKILFSFSTLNSFLLKKKILLNAMIMFRYMSGVFSCLTSINVFITIACSGDLSSR